MSDEFQGFTPPVSNYFRMPNEWINICADIKSLAELKVVQYVLRHTWGFQEYDGKPKKITLDEFMYGRKRDNGTRIDNGTGLSDRGVKDGIALAVEHGYLVCEVDDSDKARIKKFYGLKILSTISDGKNLPPEKTDRKNSPIPDRKNLPPDRKNSPIDKEESSQRSEKETKERHLKKEREKDSVARAVTQEHPTSLQQDDLSPSLSQNLSSSLLPSPEEMKPTEAKPTSVDYALFDRLCRAKGYAADFRVPRNDKNNDAIKNLREQGANAEQVEYVFNDIWNDKDPFWRQHRGKPSTVASQFTARVWKMTQPTPKRRTVSGFTNWTEDKAMGTPAVVEATPVKPKENTIANDDSKPASVMPEKPKEPSLPVGYTRLKIDKPARPRTAYGRRLQAEQMVGNDFRKEL